MFPTHAASMKYIGGTMDLGASIEALGGSIEVGLLRLSSPSSGAHVNVSVSSMVIKSSSYGNGSLIINGTSQSDSLTTVVVEHILLSSDTHVSMHTVDIQRSVIGQGATSTLEPFFNTSSSNTTSPSWTLHSIEITNAIMNVSALTSVTYKHDSPTGIFNSNGGIVSTSNSTRFLLDWAILSSSGALIAPQVGENYTMIANGSPEVYAEGRSIPFVFYRDAGSPSQLKFRLSSSGPPCALPAPTSPSFACLNGSWVASASIANTSLTLPRNAGNVTIIGNLSVSTVTFDGLGTVLVVDGCGSEVKVVRVTFGEADLETLGRSGNTKTVKLASFGNGANSTCESPVESLSVVADKQGIIMSPCSRFKGSNFELRPHRHLHIGLVSLQLMVDNTRLGTWRSDSHRCHHHHPHREIQPFMSTKVPSLQEH